MRGKMHEKCRNNFASDCRLVNIYNSHGCSCDQLLDNITSYVVIICLAWRKTKQNTYVHFPFQINKDLFQKNSCPDFAEKLINVRYRCVQAAVTKSVGGACVWNPCNGGLCYPSMESEDQLFKCDCSDIDFEGPTCEIATRM